MTNKHIAGSGAKAGQWVACGAKVCTLGGTHVTTKFLSTVQTWKSDVNASRVNLKDITEQDVKDFNKLTDEEKQTWSANAEKKEVVRAAKYAQYQEKVRSNPDRGPKHLYGPVRAKQYEAVFASATHLLKLDPTKRDIRPAMATFNRALNNAKDIEISSDWSDKVKHLAVDSTSNGRNRKAQILATIFASRLDVQNGLPLGTKAAENKAISEARMAKRHENLKKAQAEALRQQEDVAQAHVEANLEARTRAQQEIDNGKLSSRVKNFLASWSIKEI